MNPRDLVLAALHGDDLTARQFVKDAAREGFSWTTAPAPESLDAQECAVHASLVELMAARANQPAPAWTSGVGPSPSPVFLVRHAETSAAFRRDSLENTPEPLKKRNVFAVRDYLDVL